MNINNTPLRRFLAVLAALVAMTACGGGDAGASLEVSMTEFSFTESEWTVPAGEEFSLVLNNDGTVIHNWVLVKLGDEISSEADLPEDPADRDSLYLFEDSVDPGGSKTVQITAPVAGTYQVICDIQAHFSAGMAGTLTVEG